MFIKRWLGLVLLVIGISLFFINPVLNLTGYSIADKIILREVWFYVLGLGFIFIGILFAKARIPIPEGLEDIVSEVGPFEHVPNVFVDTSTIVRIREAIKASGEDPSRVDFLGTDASGSYQYFIPEHGVKELQGLSKPTNTKGYSPYGKQTTDSGLFRYLLGFKPQEQRRAGGVKVQVQKNPNLHFVEDLHLASYESKVKTAIDSYRSDSRTKRRIDNRERDKFLRGADAKLIAGALKSRDEGKYSVVLTEDSLVREVINYLNRTKKDKEPEMKAYGVGDWQKRRGYVPSERI